MNEAVSTSGSPASDSAIKLAGREFRGISHDVTAAQDDYLVGHLRKSGAVDILADMDVKKPRTQRQRAEDLLTCIFTSGRKNFILAGCLTEKGKAWSRDEANRNAETFANITDTDEKALMSSAVVKFVIGFFRSGEQSSPSSPRSSSRSERARPIANGEGETLETSLT